MKRANATAMPAASSKLGTFKRFEDVPLGWFTELCRKHDFPPGWAPTPWRTVDTMAMRRAATRQREDQSARNVGWGSGAISGLSKNGDASIKRFEAMKARAR